MATRSPKAFKLRTLLLAITFASAYAFLLPTSRAQPHLDWVRRYSLNPAATNQATAIVLAKDGGIIVAGSSRSTSTTTDDLDYLLIEYQPNGDAAWTLRYNSEALVHDSVRAMVTDGENIFVTGSSDTIKVGPTGTVLWTNLTSARSICVNKSSVVVGGFSDTDFSVRIIDSTTGTNRWAQFSDGGAQSNDMTDAIAINEAGSVFSAGGQTFICDTRTGCAQNVGIRNYSLNGSEILRAAFGSSLSSNRRTSVIKADFDSNGKMLFAYNDDVGTRYGFMRLNGTGGVEVNYALGGGFSSESTLANAAVFVSGKAFLTGRRRIGSLGLGNDAAGTIALNEDGTLAWQANYPTVPSGRSEGTAMTLDSSGNVYITGNTTNSTTGNDIFTIKYDSTGHQLWVATFDGIAHANDSATGIVVDNNGNVYVSGYSQTAEGGTEFVTLKYSQPATASIARQPSGSIRINFLTAPNTPYILQATTNYFDWTSILTNTADPTGLVQFEDPAPTLRLRLYRGAKPQ